MPSINNVEHLRAWFRNCPVLSRDNHFRVDNMAEEPVEYSLYSVPSTINYRENVLGERVPTDIQTVDFIFASKEYYGLDERQNIKNFGMYQDIVQWILEQNRLNNLPLMNEGRVLYITPSNTQYVAVPDVDSARYQIQLTITYRRY